MSKDLNQMRKVNQREREEFYKDPEEEVCHVLRTATRPE
jgi:hypothetical protein